MYINIEKKDNLKSILDISFISIWDYLRDQYISHENRPEKKYVVWKWNRLTIFSVAFAIRKQL